MPPFRILAGPSFTDLTPLDVNSDDTVYIKSDGFEGQVAAYCKGLPDENGQAGHSPYFDHNLRKGITWSIQIQGRFLQTHSADDILFGNVFDRPLKLPWGFGAVLKFMKYVDPTLEENLQSRTKPWAFSPFVATMPHIHHTHTDLAHEAPLFPASQEPIADEMSSVRTHAGVGAHDIPNRQRKLRKAHFKSQAKRRDVILGPQDFISADFCHHYLEFSEDSVVLRLPGGFSLDLLRYWDGQPIRFVCCERAKPGETKNGKQWGQVFFCVVIEKAEEVIEKVRLL